MQPEAFPIGTRVIYRDPQQPAMPLTGEVVEVTNVAVHVQYDGRPEGHGLGLVALDAAPQVLIPEAEYYRDPFAIRPANGAGAS